LFQEFKVDAKSSSKEIKGNFSLNIKNKRGVL